MSRNVIIGTVLVLAVAVGGGTYLATRDEDNKNSQATSQTDNNQPISADNTFAPVSTKDLAFSATLTTSNQPGESKIESDGKGKTRYTAITNGQQTQIIYTSDAYYLCSGSNPCIKYPTTQSGGGGFNPADYQYDDQKLGGYKNDAAYKGRQSCPAGTCDVWSVSTAGLTSTLYIDSKTKRINQVESSLSGVTTKIVYEYKNVTIDIPANAQTLPTR